MIVIQYNVCFKPMRLNLNPGSSHYHPRIKEDFMLTIIPELVTLHIPCLALGSVSPWLLHTRDSCGNVLLDHAKLNRTLADD